MKPLPAAALAVLLAISIARAAPRAESPIEPPAPTDKVEFLGVEAEGKSIIYIVQHSGAVLDTFDHIRSSLTRSMRPLTAAQSVGVIAVSESADIVCGPVAPATRARKKEITAALGKMFAQGQLAGKADPWIVAFTKIPAMHSDVIYLITKGDIPETALAQLQKSALASNAPVYVIGIHLGEAQQNVTAETERLRDIDLFKRLVEKTGGSFHTCSDSDFESYLKKPEPPEAPDTAPPPAKPIVKDGELFPDIPQGTTAPKPKPTPPPPDVATRPAPPPPRPVVVPTAPKPPSFVPTHRITLVTGRVIEGIPHQEGNKVIIKMEVGSVAFDETDIQKSEPIKK